MPINRREFLKNAGLAGGALVTTGAISAMSGQPGPTIARAAEAKPNILIVLVDQFRTPAWFPSQSQLDQYLPNLASLRRKSVTFNQYYTAATACSPARACLLTGLYSHQTALLLTIIAGADPDLSADNATEPALNPGFPTWGTALLGMGYAPWWFGKWHLSNSDACDLTPYGFSGGSCPSPDGFPGEGSNNDPCIVNQFLDWLDSSGASGGPWCTTLSLVNPHDIAWYPRFTECDTVNQTTAPTRITKLPANFETPSSLRQNKPDMQLRLQQGTTALLGALPYSGTGFEQDWLLMLNLYLKFQADVDEQIGRVLNALASSAFQNTIVIFTSDHGEYAGSHGLRGKGGGAYDEGIRVPLYVWDPSGRFTTRPDLVRRQLASSVDLLPLLLTLASNGDRSAWQSQYPHLSKRLDLSQVLINPNAPGRSYILSTTDEVGPLGDIATPSSSEVPAHVIAYRTASAKLGLYSFWDTSGGQLEIVTGGQQSELYDYSETGTTPGIWEVNNVAGTKTTLYNQSYSALNKAVASELRAPLPSTLIPYQQQATSEYIRYISSPTSVTPRCPAQPYKACST